MLCIKRHSSVAGVWREALEGLREADLAESTAEIDYHEEEVDVSVRGVFCGNAHGSRRLQFISVEGIPVERGTLHSAVEKLCKKAFRFQDNHSLTKKFPAYALQIHPGQQNMTQTTMKEVLLSAVASLLDQLGILQLPEGRTKRSRVCSASIAMTGVKPLPSNQTASRNSLDPFAHCSSLLVEQPAPDQLVQEPVHVFMQPSLFSFTPAALGGRTSKPVYCRPLSNSVSLPKKKRLLHPQSEAEADYLHPQNDGDGQQPPLQDNVLCSTLQVNEPEYQETLQVNSTGSEDSLVHLDLSFQDVFVEEEEDTGYDAMCERSAVGEGRSSGGSRTISKGQPEEVMKGKVRREPPDNSKNVQADVIVKPRISNVVTDDSDQQAEEEGCVGLELSLGSDFSERHVTSLGLTRSGYHGETLKPKTGVDVVQDNKEEIEHGSGDACSRVRKMVSAILKAWVNPQFAPRCSPIKLKQLPGLDTECQITSSQLKDALFIGQVPHLVLFCNSIFFFRLMKSSWQQFVVDC